MIESIRPKAPSFETAHRKLPAAEPRVFTEGGYRRVLSTIYFHQ